MRTKEQIEADIKHFESVIKDYHDYINKNLTTKLNKLQQELKEHVLVIPQEGCIYNIKFISGEELDIAVVKVHVGDNSGYVDYVPVGENKINYISERESCYFTKQPHYKITKLASSLKEYFDLDTTRKC